MPAESAIDAGALSARATARASCRPAARRQLEVRTTAQLRARDDSELAPPDGRVQAFDAELHDPIVRWTFLFPIAARRRRCQAHGHTDRADDRADGARRCQRGNVGRRPSSQGVRQRWPGAVLRARHALPPPDFDALVHGRQLLVPRRQRSQSDAVWSVGCPRSRLRRPPISAKWAGSWIEASVLLSGNRTPLSGGDLTDERIGAARRRSDITDFFPRRSDQPVERSPVVTAC